MALTTYTSGEVLTAASLNANLSFAASSPAGGLTCVKAQTAFSAVTSVTADNVFTSTFTNYLVKINYIATTTGDMFIKLRVGGVSTSTGYNSNGLFWSTAVTNSQLLAQTSFSIGDDAVAISSIDLQLFGPQLASVTALWSENTRNLATNDPRGQIFCGNQSAATAFDGIEILTPNSMTGNFAIYGYSKTV